MIALEYLFWPLYWGLSKVISESLARLKPIIIFDDIKYVINGRKGIFICKETIKVWLKKLIIYLIITQNSKKIRSNYHYTNIILRKNY